jgi:D-alanyl-D-alanine carboxypeptidase (penicillin-binding protein 5/6)
MSKIHFIIALILLVMPSYVRAAGPIETSAKHAIVLDYETGAVLLDKEANSRMPTSSMSKVITIAVVLDALKAGHIKLDDTYMVSEKAWRKGGSKMFVEVDKRVKVEDLIRGVIIQSGNDATIVLAEGLAGTEEAFAELLNKKARELGMDDSNFRNASGWPDPNHYSTASDLSKLAAALIRDYPQYYGYYSEKEFTYNDITQANRNPLLYRNIGADGIKTGHTDAGGYGLIGSGVRDGRRVIVVVNGLGSAKARASESAKLLEWGLQSFTNKTLFEAGVEVENADVVLGKDKTVPLTLAEPLRLTLPKITADDWGMRVHYNGPLTAPITKGQEIGKLEIDIPGFYKVMRPLYAGADVEELGFFSKTIEKAKLFIGGR